jgi:hypothetical protein
VRHHRLARASACRACEGMEAMVKTSAVVAGPARTETYWIVGGVWKTGAASPEVSQLRPCNIDEREGALVLVKFEHNTVAATSGSLFRSTRVGGSRSSYALS